MNNILPRGVVVSIENQTARGRPVNDAVSTCQSHTLHGKKCLLGSFLITLVCKCHYFRKPKNDPKAQQTSVTYPSQNVDVGI